MDQSIRFSKGITKDIIVKIQDYYVPTDFMILNMGEEKEVPIILRRPFLNTTNEIIYIGSGKFTSNSLDKSYDVISIATQLMNNQRRSALKGDGDHPVLLFTVHGHVRPIGGSGCCGWGPPWLPVLPDGSTCQARRKYAEGVGRFDDVMGAQARRKLPPKVPISPKTFLQGSGGAEVGS
jgi:hypothetical protein